MLQTGLLWKRKYFIDDGFIKPDLGRFDWKNGTWNKRNHAEPYQVMDHYKKGTGPHLELAELSLEDENAIAAFCSKWGLLGVVSRKLVFVGNGHKKALNKGDFSEANDDLLLALGVKSWDKYYYLHNDHEEWENLDHFREKAKEFQHMFRIKSAIYPKVDVDRVAELGGEDCDQALLPAQLSAWLNTELEGQLHLRTFLERDNRTGVAKEYSIYIFDDLLTGLILMIKMDLQKGTYLRQCEYRKCKRWFTTSDPRGKYCDPEHKEKEKQLRKYYKNREKINNARRKKYTGLGG